MASTRSVPRIDSTCSALSINSTSSWAIPRTECFKSSFVEDKPYPG